VSLRFQPDGDIAIPWWFFTATWSVSQHCSTQNKEGKKGEFREVILRLRTTQLLSRRILRRLQDQPLSRMVPETIAPPPDTVTPPNVAEQAVPGPALPVVTVLPVQTKVGAV
jgi:hypothetical protein